MLGVLSPCLRNLGCFHSVSSYSCVFVLCWGCFPPAYLFWMLSSCDFLFLCLFPCLGHFCPAYLNLDAFILSLVNPFVQAQGFLYSIPTVRPFFFFLVFSSFLFTDHHDKFLVLVLFLGGLAGDSAKI